MTTTGICRLDEIHFVADADFNGRSTKHSDHLARRPLAAEWVIRSAQPLTVLSLKSAGAVIAEVNAIFLSSLVVAQDESRFR
jgi:hypothetical protein